MKRLRAVFADERGVAVVLGLVALLALTALVLAFLSVSSFEPQIAANLEAGTRARYLAEAGIEAAFDSLATADWSTALTGATCDTGVLVPTTAAGSTLPGRTTASGTYTVRVRNDCYAGNGSTLSSDRVFTGLAALDATATTDTNSRLILVSTGTIGTATRTIKVVLKRVQLPTINGALSFPGVNADIDFSGSSFTIRGVDTQMGSEADGTGAAVYGISVGVAANESDIDTALANNQQNSVSGKDQTNPSATTTGDNTAAYDTTLTSSAVTDFVNAVKGLADVSINAPSTSPYSASNIGDSCASDINSATCWGTESHPKIVYIKGDSTGSTQYNALDLSGSTSGVGILIVENGNVDITGNFTWKGPVIITGTGVKIRYHGGGNQAIWGAVIVNELSNDGDNALEADISGNAKIYYSTEAIDNAMDGVGGRRLMSLYNWTEQ